MQSFRVIAKTFIRAARPESVKGRAIIPTGSRFDKLTMNGAVGICVVILFLAGCAPIVRERLQGPSLLNDGTGFTFTFDDMSASSVYLAGDFNRWGPNDNGQIHQGDQYNIQMKRREDGIWTVAVPFKEFVRDPRYDHLSDEVYLEHGRRYPYKVIINLNNWQLDPTNRNVLRNPVDNTENSLLICP